MLGERYQIRTQTLAIMTPPVGKHIPVTVPKDAVITVVDGPLEGTRLINVDWDGYQALMFSADLRERATLIDPDLA